MSDQRQRDASRDLPKLDVTNEWRARVHKALARNRAINEHAGLGRRAPERMPDDYASLARAIGDVELKSHLGKILGPALSPGEEFKDSTELVDRSELVTPVSEALEIELPSSDDELIRKMKKLSPTDRAIIDSYIGEPEFIEALAELQRRMRTRR